MILSRSSPIQPCWVVAVTLLGFGTLTDAQAAEPTLPQIEFFENRIRPILAQECYECHNSRDKAKAGLILDHRDALRAGGDSGAVIVPGDPSGSLLLQSIRHEIEDLKMPKAGARLDDKVLSDFEKWIADGAPDPRELPPTDEQLAADASWEAIRERRKGWWSFQPVAHPAIPEVEGVDHPVDRFVRSRLAEEVLEPASPADPRTLIRRLSFTLIGLPPRPEETDAFLAEWEKKGADPAVESLVDRLLASPGFGERWARHWMDWTRYADTHGSEGDPTIPYAYRYRDYLIRALNNDVPYDQLVLEHFAGDLIEDPRINTELKLNESALGIGHLRMVFHGFAPTDALDERVRFTDDQVNTITKAFMGLTVSCARCHDHKFDAISQADYYALYGIFTSGLPGTIAVDAPGVLQKNRDTLARLKPSIRRHVADYWLESLDPKSTAWTKAIQAAESPASPLYLLRKIRDANDDPTRVAAAWNEARQGFEARLAAAEENRSGEAVRMRWDLSDPEELHSWNRYGEGLVDAAPARAGEFIVASPPGDKSDKLIDRILPAGVYSHRLSPRHRGLLASAPFDLDGDYDLYFSLAGQGSSARYVVQHYTRKGTVYPIKDLADGAWTWHKFGKLDYWNGDNIHLEFATAGEPPIHVKDQDQSWFGVREAFLVKKGSPSPALPADEFLAPLFVTAGDRIPQSFNEANALYIETLREALTTWKTGEDHFDDSLALLLDGLLQSGGLPNQKEDSLPTALAESLAQYRTLQAEIPSPTRAPGLFERPGIDQPLYLRGDHKQPADPVPRRFLEAIDATPYSTDGSGRLEFAHDLLREDNPFTARVIVNRIWHHLFRDGLVPTADNFGRLGEKPTHPELLDFLAARLRKEQGWSLKSLIRDLVLTDTWRQSSQPSEEAAEKDPGNRLLSHFPVKRLEAEAIRDAIVAVSGKLDGTRYGPAATGNSLRRSVYLRVKRNSLDPLLTTFDFPTPASTVGRRDITNVPAQSLTLLNNPFIISQAGQWAITLKEATPDADDDEPRIRQLFETALSRPPTETEITRARDFLYAIDEEQRASAEQFAAIESELAQKRAALAALVEPVRARLLAEKQKALTEANEGALPETVDLNPVASWSFDENLEDAIGNLHGQFKGNARIENGALVVDGNGYVETPALPVELAEKTLEAVVQLDTFDQSGGGVITVQDLRGGAFDSIVWAERRPRRWLAGSNNHSRTLDFQASEDENEATAQPVHLAFTYETDGTIRAYRNGHPWGAPIKKADLHRFKANDTQVVFGLRHGRGIGGNKPLRGMIFEARLYDRALSEDEVRASATGERLFVSGRDIDAALTDAQRDERDRLRETVARIESQIETQRHLGSNAPPELKRWQDLAHAVFNLKEFIYLR